MQWKRLSARDRRAVMVGGAIVFGSFLGFRAIPEWTEWRTQALRSAAELKQSLARSESLLAAFPDSLNSLETRLARFKEREVGLVVGSEPDELEGSVTRLVEDAAHRSTVRILALDAEVREGEADAFRRVFVRGRAVGDVTGLATMLHALEGGPRLLAIRELAVTAHDVRTPDDQAEQLGLRFTIEALALLRQPGGGISK